MIIYNGRFRDDDWRNMVDVERLTNYRFESDAYVMFQQ